jgi:uncharacterized protein (DUF433 family)
MIPDPLTMTIPLHADDDGAIRVSGTSVTLDAVITRYLNGDSPETIRDGFDALSLNDVYAVIAYYLAHRDELDSYLARREEIFRLTREKWEAKYPPKVTRSELLKRLGANSDAQSQ